MKRIEAITLYNQLLGAAHFSEVEKKEKMIVANACWDVQGIAEITEKRRQDIIDRFAVDGTIPEDALEDVKQLIGELYMEDVEYKKTLTEEQKDALILSNPSWTIEQARGVKILL